MDEKILEALGSIEKGINATSEQISKVSARVEDLEKAKTGSNTVDRAAYEALEKKLNEEIVNRKSVSIITPGDLKKGLIEKKIDFYKSVFKGDKEKLRDMMKTAAGTYQLNETDGTGSGQLGYFVPDEFSEFITNFDVKYGAFSVVPLVYSIPMSTDSMFVNQYKNGIAAGMIGAHSTISDSAPSADRVQLVAKKIAALAYYDNELLQDLRPAVLSRIEDDARNAFDLRENYLILSGSGAADYNNASVTGILSSLTTNVVTMATSGFGDITADNLASMIDAIEIPIGQGYFVMHKSLRPAIRALKHNSQYIWSPADGGNVETIWGQPVIWVMGSNMPALSGTAAGTKFAIYGDFNKGVIKGDRLSLEVALDASKAFDTYQTAIRWVKREDFAVFGQCFSVLKTLVVE